MKREGQIKVNSENMFPIIKKWLYSDKDIFLREIVANACDAIKKYQSLCNIGETENDGVTPRIDVVVDKDAKTISVSDNGIGMTEDEVEKYITQIAFSGAEEFLEKYKDSTDGNAGIIGHFGLGFYSAYMVSESVEIDTLSHINGSAAVHWVSDGSTTYEISDSEKSSHGTTITMHISSDGEEFLDKYKLRELINKYCRFMPYEIYLNAEEESQKVVKDNDGNDTNAVPEALNVTSPLWLKAPKDCEKEEYIEFYHEVFSDLNDPLFWIHLNVDYPFRLKGILYFPKQTDKLQVMPGEIKLYSNQVYVADNIKEVLPEFLMLLKGVIDCADLPLNVSRSFLQNDGEVAKISKHITKKVADKLTSMFKNEREAYEGYWDDIAPFIKFGCIKDEKFYDKVKDIILFKTTKGEYKTFAECPKQGDKIFYVSDESVQAQYIDMFEQNSLEAVLLTHAIDTHFISFLEYKEQGTKFVRIDSELGDELKSDADEGDDNSELVEMVKSAIGDEKLEIKAEKLKTTETPAVLLQNEYMRRMSDMNKIYGNIFGEVQKANETLVINTNCDIIKSLPSKSEESRKLICNHILDLATISQRKLSADELKQFVARSVELLGKVE